MARQSSYKCACDPHLASVCILFCVVISRVSFFCITPSRFFSASQRAEASQNHSHDRRTSKDINGTITRTMTNNRTMTSWRRRCTGFVGTSTAVLLHLRNAGTASVARHGCVKCGVLPRVGIHSSTESYHQSRQVIGVSHVRNAGTVSVAERGCVNGGAPPRTSARHTRSKDYKRSGSGTDSNSSM